MCEPGVLGVSRPLEDGSDSEVKRKRLREECDSYGLSPPSMGMKTLLRGRFCALIQNLQATRSRWKERICVLGMGLTYKQTALGCCRFTAVNCCSSIVQMVVLVVVADVRWRVGETYRGRRDTVHQNNVTARDGKLDAYLRRVAG
jgi:hypothetical protein